jgi:hypothetical protein
VETDARAVIECDQGESVFFGRAVSSDSKMENRPCPS